MSVVGGMTFNIEQSGSYIGNDSVAYALSDAIFAAMQTTLDELSEKHIAPEELYSKLAMTISKGTRSKIDDTLNNYRITANVVMFSVIHPKDGYTAPVSNTTTAPTAGPTWNCPYCGSLANGNACPSCGAPYGQ